MMLHDAAFHVLMIRDHWNRIQSNLAAGHEIVATLIALPEPVELTSMEIWSTENNMACIKGFVHGQQASFLLPVGSLQVAIESRAKE